MTEEVEIIILLDPSVEQGYTSRRSWRGDSPSLLFEDGPVQTVILPHDVPYGELPRILT